jgi:signal transduction histidine kinase
VANTFVPSWLARRGPPPFVSYLLAAAVPLAAVLLDVILVQMLPGLAILGPLEILAVVVVALSWGAGPSLLATLLGAVLLHLFVLPPALTWAFHGAADVVSLLVFLAVGAIVSVIASRTERARREAKAANRRMDEFISVVSHELRQPLTGLSGTLQLMERRLRKASAGAGGANGAEAAAWQREQMGELIGRSRRQALLLDRLIGDLLDVSRIQADRLALHPAPCDLATIVREAVAEQQLAYPNREIRLELEDAGAVPLMADADRIGQVLANYVTNALKYSPEEQPVLVTLRREEGEEGEGGGARVSVRDEGPGLPAYEQTRVWERFQRIEGRRGHSDTGVGLGLGLFISKGIIQRHGGRVGVESVPGSGATFWFTVPLASGSTQSPADAEEVSAPAAAVSMVLRASGE